MKVLFFFSEMISEQFVVTGLELVLKHKRNGNSVHVLSCNGNFKTCYDNKQHKTSLCSLCKLKLKKNLKRVGVPSENVQFVKKTKHIFKKTFLNIDELKAFKHNNIDFGVAVAARLITTLRDHKPDTIKHKNYINLLLSATQTAFESMCNEIDRIQPDVIYIYNGRADIHCGAVFAATLKTIPFFTYDSNRATLPFKYTLFRQAPVHDLKTLKNLISRIWEDGSDPQRIDAGKNWFIQKRKSCPSAGASVAFTQKQQEHLLPKNFDKSKQNIVFFNSSIDEVAAMPEWKFPIYDDESIAFEKIVEFFKNKSDTMFYLRIHPNLKNQNNSQMRNIQKLADKNLDNLHIIWPDEPIDSYALIEHCDKVVTFGSTIGVEACFWGKPSILIGRAVYEDFDCCYIPKSHLELVILLKNTISAKDQKNTFPYGWWATQYDINHITHLQNYNPLKFTYSALEKIKLRIIDTLYNNGY